MEIGIKLINQEKYQNELMNKISGSRKQATHYMEG